MSGKGMVMVVDDEEPIREALRQALEQAGYNASTAASGQEALDTLRRQEVEVMLLDMKMPGLSGFDVLQRVHYDHPDLAVIMVTAQVETAMAVDAMKAGAYDYATKPVDLDDLILRVHKALERRRLLPREREYKRELDQKLREQESRLSAQFGELIESLAREHATLLELEALRSAKRAKGLFSRLPAELQQPKASVEDFARALIKVLESGGLKSE